MSRRMQRKLTLSRETLAAIAGADTACTKSPSGCAPFSHYPGMCTTTLVSCFRVPC